MPAILFLLLHLMLPAQEKNILFLGDSYTIGEGVGQSLGFPEQTVKMLEEKGINCSSPEIIARTGWTTQSLINAVDRATLSGTYDYVVLLIGVNDQYQEVDIIKYNSDFEKILKTAIHFAGNNKDHVIVMSIPDYGITPFAKYEDKSPAAISKEIDVFNSSNRRISLTYNTRYLDITGISRKAENDPAMLAADGLHPSGKMYAEWATELSALISASENK